MTKILLPIDFSQASEKAVQVAGQIAALNNAAIEVIHVYNPQLDPAFPYVSQPTPGFHEKKEQELKAYIDGQLKKHPWMSALEFSTKAEVGTPVQHIVDRTKEDFGLLVMGTAGDHGLLDKVFGSVSTAVLQEAYCPALLVPMNFDYHGFHKILYASNRAEGDQAVLPKVLQMASLFDAELHFVHVDSEQTETPDVRSESLLAEGAPASKVTIASIPGSDVTEELNRYIDREGIDLAVMATRHRNFINHLFHRSITRRMAMNAKLPLLVLHFD